MIKKIFINSQNRIRLLYKFPVMLVVSYLLSFYFGYLLIYNLQFFFSERSGVSFDFDYVSSSIGDMKVEQITWELAFIAVVFLFAKYIDRFSYKDLGIYFNKTAVSRLLTGIVAAAFFIVLPFLINLLLGTIEIEGFYWNVNISGKSIIIVFIYETILLMLVAFQEELFNRGYLLNCLSKIKPVFAIIISSVLFSLLHILGADWENNPTGSLIGVLNILLIGVIYSYYFIHTKDLWLIMGAHFSWNLIQGAVLGLPISGDPGKGLLVTRVIQDNLLTGGNFGLEGGLLVTASLVAMFIALHFYVTRIKSGVKSGDGSPNQKIRGTFS